MSDRQQFGRFELRRAERRLLRDGEPVRLGARAFDVLLALVDHRGRLLTKGELLDLAWPGLVVEEANVQVQVSALRKVLGPQAVATIPGLGYRLTMVPDDGNGPAPGSLQAASPGTAPPQACTTNVPAEADSLVGRDADVAALDALLDAHRLVTVVGPGGIGKTRLALETARLRLGRYPRGVWWVDLAALSSARQVAPGIAKAVDVPLGGDDATAALIHALAPHRLLLVLDNCEHLAPALGGIVQSLLAGAAGVQVLATSQVALRLRGERVQALGPLDVPEPGASLDEARHCGATLLLQRRAAAADRRFSLTAANAAQAIELCRQLDGMPLAIEMAAARLPVLGFAGVQQQLADRLDRLQARMPDVPPRQRSLRSTLDWSHSLLGRDEQTLLRRLSVFAGSVRLDVVQEAARCDRLDAAAVLEALAGLVEKSLVKLVELDPPRYRLLETTRLYAQQKLQAAGEAEAMRRRHGQAMAALAETASREAQDGNLTPWLARHLPDYDDLQLAFDEACVRDDSQVGAAVVTTLRLLDQLRGLLHSSGRRVAAACGLLEHAGPRAEALLHTFIASCGWTCPPRGSRVASARRGVELWRALGDRRMLHGALAIAATESARAGDHDAADTMLAEAREIEDADWPDRSVAVRMFHEGWVAQERGDASRCRDIMRAAVALCRRAGEQAMANSALVMLASATLAAGDVRDAVRLARAAVRALRGTHQTDHLGYALCVLCESLLAAGDRDGARAASRQAWPLTAPDAAHHAELTRCAAALASYRARDGANRSTDR